jgi:hypothetical protein
MTSAKQGTAPHRWPYYVLAFAFVGVCYYVGWIGKDVLVLPSLAAAFVCVALGNLDRFKSFKAGPVEAVLRDAQVAVQESRDLTLTVSKMLLALVKRTGRFGSFSPAQEREFQESVERILIRVEATEAERKEAFKDWELFTKIDFVFGILGGHTIPDFKADAQVGTREWKALRDRTGNDLAPPSPDELGDFLQRHKFMDEERRELIEDYRYFLKNSKHRRPEVWERREEWAEKTLGK